MRETERQVEMTPRKACQWILDVVMELRERNPSVVDCVRSAIDMIERYATDGVNCPKRNIEEVESLDAYLSPRYMDDMMCDMIHEWREDEVRFDVEHPGEGALLHAVRWLFMPYTEES